MTETDWHASHDPLAMYRLLQESTTLMRTRWQGWVPVRRFHFSARRETLFRCAVCDRLVDIVGSETARQVIDHLREEYLPPVPARPRFGQRRWRDQFLLEADTQHEGEVATAWNALRALLAGEDSRRSEGLFLAAVARAEASALDGDLWQRARVLEAEKVALADLLREFAGNPFHTTQLPDGWECWQDGLILDMAGRIDRENDLAALPILGDALEDAGCRDPHLLQHCHQNAPHQRGCWVLELLLTRD